MSIRKDFLEVALSTIHEKSYRCCKFTNLVEDVHINGIQGAKLPKIYAFLRFIQQDIWSIETIAFRLNWEKKLWSQEKLDVGLWMTFAKCDIDLFHVEFRSVFDYLAKIIKRISDFPDQVKDGSFTELRNWVIKPGNDQKIGKDLAQLVNSCYWFENIKEIRESIVHRGGFTIVFPEKNRILFQVYRGIDKNILLPEIMYNENVVDFELYAGLYFGYMLSYLEEFSEIVYNRLNLKRYCMQARSIHSGLSIISDWINRVVSLIP